MSETETGKKLSYPKMGLLGLQHVFAMFGATILVPLISGLSVQVTLIGVGLGTLVFHFITKGVCLHFSDRRSRSLSGYS